MLICPNLDAANILFNVLKMTGRAMASRWARSCMGAAATAYILTPGRHGAPRVNMTALAVALP
jgi:malate dehydrogenase (oxaloacetate-decarboxylating)(NADP+)